MCVCVSEREREMQNITESTDAIEENKNEKRTCLCRVLLNRLIKKKERRQYEDGEINQLKKKKKKT